MTPKDANVALSFAEVAKIAAQATAGKQSPAPEPKSHETAKQGGEWQTVTRRKADKTAHPAPRQDDRILVRISASNKLRDCESFLMTEKLKKLDAGLGKALKNVQKTKSGFALIANKDCRTTLLEKSDKIKKYLGPGTEVAQALNTDAYLIGPVVRHLNGGGKAVEVTEEMIRVCFAEATRIAPVYMTEKTRGNEKTFIAKIPANGAKVPRQLRMGSRLVPVRLLAEKPKATPQCTRCFGWHDAKKCSRAQLCRHCGSSEHESSKHPACCEVEHQCVSACFICRGPHPADSKECPLRKKGTTPEERRVIRKEQQKLTSEKWKACPKASKKTPAQAAEQADSMEAQEEGLETPEGNPQTEDRPVEAEEAPAPRGNEASEPPMPEPTPSAPGAQGLRKSARTKARQGEQPQSQSWDTRPRVMTYVRNTIMATLVPVCDGEHADVVIVELTGQGLHIANVYNANPQDTSRGVALVRAQKTVKDKKMILCGDLNLHSHMWDSRKSESRDCSLILDWLSEDDVTLLNEPDDNTCFHSKESPSVIDLAFASSTLLGQTGCTTKVMKELNCGSDHFPLSTTIEGIQIDDVVRATRHNMNRLDTEKFTRACARESTSLNAREALRAEDAEELAAGLIKAMTKALDEAAPKALGRGTGKRWWNPQCTGAVREMRSAWRQTEADNFPDASYDAYKEKRRAFQAEIRTAKRELWRQTIENMTDATDVFRMVNRLGKTNPAGGLPPLTQGGTTRRTPQEKAEALLDTHTQPAEDRSRTEEEANPRARLWGKLTPTEVRDAVFHAGNTAPGEDGIPNTAWKLAWPIFGHIQGCDDGGDPETISRQETPKELPADLATVNPREKPRESDSAKAVDTGDRTTDHPATLRVSGTQEGGHRPDLETGGCHQREADSQAEKPAMARIPVQVGGVFPDGQASEPFCGRRTPSGEESRGSLPQGSPASPILYMLFMADLFKKMQSLGYADDGLIYVSSRSVKANLLSIGEWLRMATRWCSENELEIDWSKTGFMHLYKGRKAAGMNEKLQMPDGTWLAPMDEMKWLGVWWDPSLSFNKHCKETMAKARRTINVLRHLSRVYFGIPPKSALQVIRACVVPQLTYAATTWYPMASKTALDKLEVVLRDGIRAALPVYKTTNKPSLYRFAAFPSLRLICQEMIRAGGIRAYTCNTDHPLHITTIDGTIDKAKAMLPFPIRDTDKLLPEGEGPPDPLAEKLSKEEAAKAHLKLLEKESQDTIWVYSDGSRDSDGNTGAGWAVYHGGKTLAQGSGACGKYREVADAEAIAALRAVRIAAEVAPPQAEGLNLCVDNLGVAKRISKRMRKPGTSQLEVDEIRRILAKWEGGTECLSLDKPVGRVHWVPGHCEVPGNEVVDQLAKAGCKSSDLLVPERTMSLAAARRWKNDAFRADFKDWMIDNCPNTDHLGGALGIPKPYKLDWMRGLNRGTVARILAARSKHGDFEEYHTRFNHQDAETKCQVPNCGKPKDFSHPWECIGNATRLAGRPSSKIWRKGFLAANLHPQKSLEILEVDAHLQ
ncbi:Endonuclease/Exonuclease/phosphatase family protein [Ceratocystis lukuohia]|uniref:Endonuclease/Exonuclease/phosphatase family protein n=1 Tax=Ceratocystis lukuohia TaxID=2019550 RepID=A0ABR4MS80_9PEZI